MQMPIVIKVDNVIFGLNIQKKIKSIADINLKIMIMRLKERNSVNQELETQQEDRLANVYQI